MSVRMPPPGSGLCRTRASTGGPELWTWTEWLIAGPAGGATRMATGGAGGAASASGGAESGPIPAAAPAIPGGKSGIGGPLAGAKPPPGEPPPKRLPKIDPNNPPPAVPCSPSRRARMRFSESSEVLAALAPRSVTARLAASAACFAPLASRSI